MFGERKFHIFHVTFFGNKEGTYGQKAYASASFWQTRKGRLGITENKLKHLKSLSGLDENSVLINMIYMGKMTLKEFGIEE